MRPLFMVLLLAIAGCGAMGIEYGVKVQKASAPANTIPGKHHCDVGEEVECCCIKDATGKISNCTCLLKE